MLGFFAIERAGLHKYPETFLCHRNGITFLTDAEDPPNIQSNYDELEQMYIDLVNQDTITAQDVATMYDLLRWNSLDISRMRQPNITRFYLQSYDVISNQLMKETPISIVTMKLLFWVLQKSLSDPLKQNDLLKHILRNSDSSDVDSTNHQIACIGLILQCGLVGYSDKANILDLIHSYYKNGPKNPMKLWVITNCIEGVFNTGISYDDSKYYDTFVEIFEDHLTTECTPSRLITCVRIMGLVKRLFMLIGAENYYPQLKGSLWYKCAKYCFESAIFKFRKAAFYLMTIHMFLYKGHVKKLDLRFMRRHFVESNEQRSFRSRMPISNRKEFYRCMVLNWSWFKASCLLAMSQFSLDIATHELNNLDFFYSIQYYNCLNLLTQSHGDVCKKVMRRINIMNRIVFDRDWLDENHSMDTIFMEYIENYHSEIIASESFHNFYALPN